MGIFNFNKNNKVEIPTNTSPEKKGETYGVDNVMNFSMQTSLPVIKEERSYEWVKYVTDEGEQFPIYLEKLFNTSPTHQAIIETKSIIVAGDGYEVNKENLTSDQELDLEKMLEYFDGKNTIEFSIKKMAKHFELYGAVALEIIWSLDFSKIVKINVINPKHIRSGKFEDGEIKEYFYKRDWDDRREEEVKIAAFDVNDNENHRQLLYMGTDMISNEYYFEPSYIASCNWVQLEASIGEFYSSLLENGFNPSVIVKFFRKPASLEDRDEVVRGLKRSFGGVKNSGKAVVLFSDGKELAPEIEPIAVNNLDKQYTVISDQITTKILTGHKVTTPEMFGIAIPGKMGTADFETQVEAFQKFVITPNQKFINRIINKILKINGLDVNFTIKPLDLFKTNNTQN